MRFASARGHHWWRWILAGVAACIALVVLAVALVIKLAPISPPLVLPTAPAGAPVGLVTGTWNVGLGSVAGFRVTETALGFSNDVVGRTSAVTGTITVARGQVTGAAFRVGLSSLKISGQNAATAHREPAHATVPDGNLHPGPAGPAAPRLRLGRGRHADRPG